MHSSNFGFQSKFAILSVALLLVTIWLLLHGYHGLVGDGQIYAFQAWARLHPQLTTDLYLQNTSQDQFTLFSPLYAWFIGVLGLENASRLLTLAFTIWFLAATWSFVRHVAGRDAWLGVAFILIVAGDYGGSGVFQILDPFLTARLPAEALIITALACHVRGMKLLGLSLAFGAIVIHPLMALPGLLLIACLWLPIRLAVIGAIGGILTTFVIQIVAIKLPTLSPALNIMDASWLDVVRERSQFLFLQLWSIHDWEINVQPFASLGFTALVVAEGRIRKLCAAAALVGAAGLVVGFIGGLIGPIAILVQGQAWRWVWITVFVSVALVPFSTLQAWRDAKCGPLCSLLLLSGWTLPGVHGTVCISLALIFWLTREHFSPRLTTYFRWISATIGIAIVVWIFTKNLAAVSPPTPLSGHVPSDVTQIQDMFAMRIPAVLLAAVIWWGGRTNRSKWIPTMLCTMLLTLSIFALPAAFKQSLTLATATEVHEFVDWTNAIPPTSTVLVAPPRDVGAFVWFTLHRPNYLVLDQSSGVVFSRATALEIRRRSEVLLPVMDPDWRILTRLRVTRDSRRQYELTRRPLTAKSLVQICADPQLGFVISAGKLGFDPLRHEHSGPWNDWNLYDCRKVRSAAAAI